jgi:prepilin-type N-terminal cleavage/methylation domain-containing protein
MKSKIHTRTHQTPYGFTLLELMVAMVILVIAMSIVFQAFTGTIRGWKRGTEVADGIKHGDFAIQQLASALNSTLYFNNPRKSYACTFEKGNTAGLPADTLSFVTTSSAFMPAGSPLRYGPHRIKIYIDSDNEGNPALFAMAAPALVDIEDFEDDFDTEPQLVSRSIQGLEIMVYNEITEDWTEEWDKENSVPERIKIMVYVPSDDPQEDPLVFTRVLEIPVAKSVKVKLAGPSSVKKSTNRPTRGRTSGSTKQPRGGASINRGRTP